MYWGEVGILCTHHSSGVIIKALRLGRKQSKGSVTIESGVRLQISGLIYQRNCLLPRLPTYGIHVPEVWVNLGLGA